MHARSRRTSGTTIRLLATGMVASTLFAVAGCQSSDEPAPATPDDRVYSLPAGAVGGYCEVQGLRAQLASGEISADSLPTWADLTVVNGTPRIVDFTHALPDGMSTAQTLDKLFASPGLRGVDTRNAARRTCEENTTDKTIELEQGGPGYYLEVD